MKKPIRIDFINHAIIITRDFQKLASDVRSEEYATLQRVRQDYPEFSVGTRCIRKNPNKKTYKNLTYEYMETYIRTHGTLEQSTDNLTKFGELYIISKCHNSGIGYATIKNWFLQEYPEVATFSIEAAAEETEKRETA